VRPAGPTDRPAHRAVYAGPLFWLDRVLALAERVDRRRRGLRPVRAGGVLAVELSRYRGPPVVLVDGSRVGPGDVVAVMHFRNDRVRAVSTSGWHAELWRIAREDLSVLAGWCRSRPPAARPVALRATTLLGSLLRRDGWEIRQRTPSPRARLDDWFMRWLLRYWGHPDPAGHRRHASTLVSVDCWLSASALERRFPG
jgi:YkoP domain